MDLRLPCLQDVKLFFGVHVEGAVEGVKEREKTSDEGYVQRHQVRVTIWVCACVSAEPLPPFILTIW